MTRLLLIGLLGFAGCVPNEVQERDLPRYTANAMCNLERDCARGLWLNAYANQGDCKAHWERDMEALVDFFDDIDCDYNKREASKALDKLFSMDCEDWYEDVFEDQGAELLDEVWDECGNYTTFPYTFPYTSQP